jgi:hypothetical protein
MFGKVDNKKTLKFNNYYVRFSEPMELLIKGKMRRSFPAPISINDERIFVDGDNDIERKPYFNYKDSFSEYIFSAIKADLEDLPNGMYQIKRFNMVLGKNGELAYFDFDSLQPSSDNYKNYHAQTIAPIIYESESKGALKTTKGSFGLDKNDKVDDKAAKEVMQLAVQSMINSLGLDQKDTSKGLPITFAVPKEITTKIYQSLYNALKNCPKFQPALKRGKVVYFLLDPIKYGSIDIYVVKNKKAVLQKIQL